MIDSELLTVIATNVARIDERVATLKERSNSHEEKLTELIDGLHAVELTLVSKRRPLVLGAASGAIVAALVNLVTHLLASP